MRCKLPCRGPFVSGKETRARGRFGELETREVTEGKAARLEVTGRKQVKKKNLLCLYGYAALCATKMQTARRGQLGDA